MIKEWTDEFQWWRETPKLDIVWCYTTPNSRWWAPWRKPAEPYLTLSYDDFVALYDFVSEITDE